MMKSVAALALAATVSAKTGPWSYNGLKHGDDIEGEYLVQFKAGAKASATAFVHEIADLTGANVQYSSKYSSVFGLRGVSAEALDKLKSHPDVELITPNQVVTIFGDDTVINDNQCPEGRRADSWGLVRATNEAYSETATFNYDSNCGEGVQLHVLDTGVDFEHEDFTFLRRANLTASGDFTLEGDFDGHGHGTHVASSAAGEQYGFSTCAQVVSLKVLSSSGAGNLFSIMGAMEIGQEEALKGNRVVVNMSLGALVNPILNGIATQVSEDGVMLVAAAGNDNGDASFASPASAEGVWTVGASAIDDTRSVFSNFGAPVDIFAPGTNIKAACPLEDRSTNPPTARCGQIAGRPGESCNTVDGVQHCYAIISGTSMACPHAAGVAATAWSMADNREMNNRQLASMLEEISLKGVLSDIPDGTVNALLQRPC